LLFTAMGVVGERRVVVDVEKYEDGWPVSGQSLVVAVDL
jgi:hypothetical protein